MSLNVKVLVEILEEICLKAAAVFATKHEGSITRFFCLLENCNVIIPNFKANEATLRSFH